jgi:hypothetical protein
MITIITIFVAIILTIVIAMSITIIITIIIAIIAAIITMLVQEPGHACHLLPGSKNSKLKNNSLLGPPMG